MTRDPILIDDATFNDRVKRLIASKGDLAAAGLTLEDVSDLTFTRMSNVNPNVAKAVEEAPKRATPKAKPGLADLLG